MKQRTGRSDDQEVGFLKAVPAVGSTPAAVWVKVITTEPTWTETLLLCHAAGCASKVRMCQRAGFGWPFCCLRTNPWHSLPLVIHSCLATENSQR